MIWFSSDLHLGHANIMKYCSRPFKSVDEMDDYILTSFESTIRTGDILYFLGDLTFKRRLAETFFDFLEGVDIFFVKGNHDKGKVLKLAEERSVDCAPQMDVSLGGQLISLNHFCMRVWNKSHFNSWHLYGHSHGSLEPIGKSWDVGVDNNNFAPVSFDTICDIMESRPDNANYLSMEERNKK